MHDAVCGVYAMVLYRLQSGTGTIRLCYHVLSLAKFSSLTPI